MHRIEFLHSHWMEFREGSGAWHFVRNPGLSMGAHAPVCADIITLKPSHLPTQELNFRWKPSSCFLPKLDSPFHMGGERTLLSQAGISHKRGDGMGNVCGCHWLSKQGRQRGGRRSGRHVAPPSAPPASRAARGPVEGWIFMWRLCFHSEGTDRSCCNISPALVFVGSTNHQPQSLVRYFMN